MAKTDKSKTGVCHEGDGAAGDMEAMARDHTTAAIATLAHMMTDEMASPSVRVAAANALLDRAWGRARQAERRMTRSNIGELSDEELVQIIWDGARGRRTVDEAPGAKAV